MEQEIRARSKNIKLVEEKREVILSAAVSVFLEKGYQKTTMRDIADAAGMVSGNIYNYIGSKDDILHLMCLSGKKSIENWKRALNSLKGKNSTDKLAQGIRTFFEVVSNSSNSLIFFNREILSFSHEDRAILLVSIVEYVKLFEKLIREGIKKGEFETDSPFILAHNIVTLGYNWVYQRWYLRHFCTFEDYTNQQIQILTKSLAHPKTRSMSSKNNKSK